MIKVLIAESDDKTSALISFALETKLNVDVIHAENAHEAIEEVKQNGKLALIISAFNMPGGNGDILYYYLQDNKIDIPFVLCSMQLPDYYSAFKDKKLFGYIIKPDINAGISKVIKSLTQKTTFNLPEYVPVSLTLFKNTQTYLSDVFVQLSKDKFVKVYKKGDLCTIEDFKKYIQQKWQSGMNWQNWGKGNGKWNLDHILPIELFDLKDFNQQKICFHYTNFQPLWEKNNLEKNDFLANGIRAKNLTPEQKLECLKFLGFNLN